MNNEKNVCNWLFIGNLREQFRVSSKTPLSRIIAPLATALWKNSFNFFSPCRATFLWQMPQIAPGWKNSYCYEKNIVWKSFFSFLLKKDFSTKSQLRRSFESILGLMNETFYRFFLFFCLKCRLSSNPS